MIQTSAGTETREIQRLLRDARGLPHGHGRIALTEQAVALADRARDEEVMFSARIDLVQSATYGGAPEKALTAFAWCLAKVDAAPQRHDEADILWQYKWIADKTPYFPHISLERIDAITDDLAARFEKHAWGSRAALQLRFTTALSTGRLDRARSVFEAWRTAPKGGGDDCAACQQNRLVQYYHVIEDDALLLKSAMPILEGRLRCAEIPHVTLGYVLRPLLRAGRVEEAVAAHKKGYRLVRRGADFLGTLSEHLTFLTVTDNRRSALNLFERHLALAMRSWDAVAKLDYGLASRLLLTHLAHQRQAACRLRLPREFPLYREDGRYTPADLAAWFDREARQLAAAFDQRNGNAYRSSLLDASNRDLDRIRPVPLNGVD